MKTVAIALLSLALTGCATQKSAPVLVSGKTLVFQGPIYANAADEFVGSIEQHEGNRVLIASAGGYVAPALRMAQVIYDRGMDVEVFGQCFSSCANYIFSCGKNIAITGTWLEDVSTLAAHEADFYKTVGVDTFVTWFGKIPSHDVRDTYFQTPHDMARFGIHNVAVRPDYAQTDLAPYNASGVEKVRFVAVQWDSLRALSSESPT